MKKRLYKLVAMLLVTAMFMTDLSCIESDGSWFTDFRDALVSTVQQVFAADDSAASEDEYYFLLSAQPITNGGEINYSKFSSSNLTLNIVLGGATITSGASVSWNISNENVIDVRNQTNTQVTLDILSPGYSTLIASMTDPDGTFHSAIAYCTIHVPLEWDDTNNIKSTASDPYGLIVAQNGDKTTNYTLQLYTSNSGDFPNEYHYLRKLKYIDYTYKAGVTNTGDITSSVDPDLLATPVTALTWSSSDTSVVEVDEDTGVVTAVHSGFAKVTVATETDDGTNDGDSLSFNVVVVPQAYVSGYTTDYLNDMTIYTLVNSSEVVVQSNARYASDLSWQLFQGDTPSNSTDITKTYADNMDVSDATGRVVLTDLPAGVYTLTAIPVKDSDSSQTLSTYSVLGANIEYLQIVMIVTLTFPDQNLILNYYSEDVADSYDLIANSNMPDGLFRFTTSDAGVATVGTNDGLIEATGLGSCTVSISISSTQALRKIFGDYATTAASMISSGAPYVINVTVVNGVTLNQTSATMYQGATLQLSLEAPKPYEGTIKWSSSKDTVASVDDTGLVTAVGTGECYITVRIKVNGITKRARCKIKVISSVNTITLSSKFDYVEVGDNLTISAKISPNVNGTELSWSLSDEAVASFADVSALSCTITGVKAGTVVVTAVNPDNEIVATKIIQVIQDITSITLSDSTVTISIGMGSYQLYATCSPELPDNQSLTWTSSDTKLATVDSTGLVKLVKTGTVVITVVTQNGLTAQCTFTITQGVTGIVLDETALELYVGDKYRMTYTVKPSNATDMTLKWSVLDSKIVTVDNTGYITAKNVGSTVIMVQSTDGTGIFTMCTVTVYRNATGIAIDVKTLSMNVGETYQLATTLSPADSTDTVSYESSNTKVVNVSKAGKITAKGKGTAVVMAKTSAGVSTYCTVEVTQQVTGLSLSMSEAEVFVGETITIEATVAPKTASDTEVTWSSSNTGIATVKDGVVTGVSGGFVSIKCVTTDGDYVAYCMVTVKELVTSVTIDEEAEVGVGKKITLTATVSGETANNKNVVWSTSSKKIATVNSKGVVKGVKVGTCIITCTAADGSGAYAECELKVINATDDIIIDADDSYIELLVGESHTVGFTTEPASTTYTPVWESADSTIAIVNKNGRITGIKAGTVVVTATAKDNPNATANVTVKVSNPVTATNVTLSDSEIVMTVGETKTVKSSILPTNVTESASWSSDNAAVARVDASTGKITAVTYGTANVTLMTDSGKKATVTVYVVGLSETEVTLSQYESLLLSLQIDGAPSSGYTIRWGTNNQEIAVMSNGAVTAKALGTTKVYAMVNGRKLECTVHVIKNK